MHAEFQLQLYDIAVDNFFLKMIELKEKTIVNERLKAEIAEEKKKNDELMKELQQYKELEESNTESREEKRKPRDFKFDQSGEIGKGPGLIGFATESRTKKVHGNAPPALTEEGVPWFNFGRLSGAGLNDSHMSGCPPCNDNNLLVGAPASLPGWKRGVHIVGTDGRFLANLADSPSCPDVAAAVPPIAPGLHLSVRNKLLTINQAR